MLDLICHSTFGTLLNALSGGRVLLFAEQRPDYVVVSVPPTQAPAKPRVSVQRKGKDLRRCRVYSYRLYPRNSGRSIGYRGKRRQAADPFLVDWESMIMTQIIYLVAELVNRVYDYLTV